MIKYVGTLETVHFVNWVLYSGYVDPAELVRRAMEEIKKESPKEAVSLGEGECYEQYIADEMPDRLKILLSDVLDNALGEIFPDYYGRDDLPGIGSDPEDYQGGDYPVQFLFAPIMATGLEELNLYGAARYILAHVNQTAEVA